jgi:hypothetical protein
LKGGYEPGDDDRQNPGQQAPSQRNELNRRTSTAVHPRNA